MPSFHGMLPRRIVPQILLLMLTAMIAMVAIMTAIFLLARPEPLRQGFGSALIRIGIAVDRMNGIAAADRPALVADQKHFVITLLDTGEAIPDPGSSPPPILTFLPGPMGNGLELVAAVQPGTKGRDAVHLYFRLKDGGLVRVELPPRPEPPLFGDPLLLLLMFSAICLVLLVLWVTLTLIRPLSDLSASVALFGLKTAETVPVAERGANEVREVARAVNRMQRRIVDLIEKRTRMLAAIGHDLKTPITRLRLRLELYPEDEAKRKNLADLDMMETQLGHVVTFLREGRSGEDPTRFNLPSLLQGIADLYEDTGLALQLDCEAGLTVNGRPGELNRALSNLIDNARRYDDRIILRARSEGTSIHIEVVDHGPGIADADRTRMMEPFERGDAARQLDKSGGMGLGLATASAIAEGHGGALTLLHTDGGGLTARITMPAA